MHENSTQVAEVEPIKSEVRGTFPKFIKRTQLERIQNLPEVLKNSRKKWEITRMLDGSSITIYHHEGDFGICTHNLSLKLSAGNNDNTYVKTARNLGFLTCVELYYETTGINIAIQGELMGPKIQGNPDALYHHDIFVFDIWNIDEQRYLSPNDRNTALRFFRLMGYPFQVAPKYSILSPYNMRLYDKPGLFVKTVDDLIEHVTRICAMGWDRPTKGLVFKAMDNDDRFKALNNEYLLGAKP